MDRHDRRAAKRRKSTHPECKMVCEESESEAGVDLYIVFDGVKIARRGYPDSPQSRTWVSLEPGFQVLDGENNPDTGEGEIVILRNGVAIQ